MMSNKAHGMTRRGQKKKQGGFTAIEVMVVIIIGIVIYALSTGKLSQLFGKSNVSEEISNVNTLLANTKQMKTTSGYGASGTNLVPQLISAGGVPPNVSVIGGVLYNTWGGAITIVSTGAGFTIQQATVPQDACIAMVTKIAKGGAFFSTKVNAATAVTGEYTTAQANTDCTSATSNTTLWTSNS
ncbi:type 4 pilus major pilin [Chromobacterium haemolyticum]|uniref:type 4 pilus major pilin n=1 Tax=Chromobacterium haemolyticum TaxID=394935 RepID=UPI0024498085|nr:type 4 pilus major pilin [Chromobacterium haemolyticum]MDH0341961.1 prepilin-type N-terminal cleavage/methylation domain-containing protein [Chromobacterium haemolyticum]